MGILPRSKERESSVTFRMNRAGGVRIRRGCLFGGGGVLNWRFTVLLQPGTLRQRTCPLDFFRDLVPC